MSRSEALLDFYRGEGPDSEGRRIEEIWSFTFDQLESTHDFIQWLFPLRTRSSANLRAPLLDDATVRAFLDSPALRKRLRRSLDVMLRFYGLACENAPSGPVIGRRAGFSERMKVWLWPGNHNHLRLTRIIESLRMLGLPAEAEALYRCLVEIASDYPKGVSGESLRFWRNAATG